MWVYEKDAWVRVTVDRSQWMLDVARSRDHAPTNYDLALAAKSGRSYRDQFPKLSPITPAKQPLAGMGPSRNRPLLQAACELLRCLVSANG